jgi:hypothetical protein
MAYFQVLRSCHIVDRRSLLISGKLVVDEAEPNGSRRQDV